MNRPSILLTLLVSVLVFSFFAAAPVRAVGFTVGSTTYDESILTDDFNGASLNTQWDLHTANAGTVGMNGTDSVILRTVVSSGTNPAKYQKSTAYINYETNGGLNYGSSPNDWAVELKFQMRNETNGFEWNSPVGSGYQWSILGGYATTDDNGWSTLQGFDLRAVRNGQKWSLGWYGGDYTPVFAFNDRPSTIDIVPEPSLQKYWLHNDETYTIGLHRKPDGNVDIYLTGNVYDSTNSDAFVTTYNNQLLATKPLINPSINSGNPGGLVAGDWTQSGIGGWMALDSLKMGIAPSASVQGDYNGNGTVDAADYVVWRKNQGGSGGSASVGDSEPDGDVDDVDYTFWRERFGNSTPGSGSGAGLSNSTVPEPAAVLLLTVGAGFWWAKAGARGRTKRVRGQ